MRQQQIDGDRALVNDALQIFELERTRREIRVQLEAAVIECDRLAVPARATTPLP